jgi:hypothetical protein
MRSGKGRCLAGIFATAVLVAGAARAADPAPSSDPAPSPEMRQKMAAVHQKMAACLQSDKPIGACRSEMMQGCQETMGADGCPMMGKMGGGMGPGMMGGGGMHGQGMMKGQPSN